MLAEVSLAPVGEGSSVSRYVAKALSIIEESGIRHEFHSMGTNLEGEYDEIMALVKKCADAMVEMGAQRVIIRMYIDDRRDKPSTIDGKKGCVTLKENCRISSHTTIMPGVTIGKNAVVGAHSFVNRDIPDNVVAFGCPAEIIRTLEK